MKRVVALFLVGVVAAACSEQLTAPGQCPTYCPGGASVFKDTVLTAVVGGDSTYAGFAASSDLLSLLVSSGGQYGQARGVIRFLPRGDSILVRDTNRTFTIDSMVITVALQFRDTTQTHPYLDVYRLPLTIDSTSTVEQIDAAMTPDRLLDTIPLAADFKTGSLNILLDGEALSRVTFTSTDSTRLQIGVRVRADAPTAARVATPASGTLGPTYTVFIKANIADTTLQAQAIARSGVAAFTVRPPGAPLNPALLSVGGFPVTRSFLRFELPAFLRDSATIIRATLSLQGAAPLTGIPADTATLVAAGLIADFGAKSPARGGALGLADLFPGAQTFTIEIADLVRGWQGTDPLPNVIRLTLAGEGSTFLAPAFLNSRATSGAPTLRITYRPPFSFAGY